MKLVWHIVRKDLIRLRWILLLWVVMSIGALGLAAIQPGLDHETYFPFWLVTSVVVAGFLPLIAFGLVMGLLHDDPVAEIDAFWITRPISGAELLFAKLTALLLLALIPVLTTIPFWLGHDYDWSQIAQAAGYTLQSDFLLVMLALPFAVISPNASKFVMNVMVSAGGLWLLVLFLRLGNSRETEAGVSALVESKAWLIAGLWFFTAVIVTLNQFLRRRTRQSMALMGIAVAAGFVVARWWPWSLIHPLPASKESATASIAAEPGVPVFSAVVAGEAKRMAIVAEVPLTAGASSFLHGRMLKIQSVLQDYTGELQISFSEATPRLSGKFHDLLSGTAAQPEELNYYFITNHAEGGAFAVTPVRRGYDLDVATLHFSHSTISVRPELAWQGKPAANLITWLKGAVLVQALAADPKPIRAVP